MENKQTPVMPKDEYVQPVVDMYKVEPRDVEFGEPKINGMSYSSNFDTVKTDDTTAEVKPKLHDSLQKLDDDKIDELLEETDNFLSDYDILQQRQAEYGDASESFGAIAQMWSAYLGTSVSKQDVAMMMGLMKINRSKTSSGFHYYDSLQDCRNYMTLAEQMTKDDKNGN